MDSTIINIVKGLLASIKQYPGNRLLLHNIGTNLFLSGKHELFSQVMDLIKESGILNE